MMTYRVDVFMGLGRKHCSEPFENYNSAKDYARVVKKIHGDDSKVFILESVADLKYDVLEEVEYA